MGIAELGGKVRLKMKVSKETMDVGPERSAAPVCVDNDCF